ncbi:MAG: ligase-associated DNA damage response endonuclease PdeM [Flammeovirgaceae bacterium]|nr:ligase-associated DNA damage response endonuclease PdeM [Flammeovirgaceae bacterium]
MHYTIVIMPYNHTNIQIFNLFHQTLHLHPAKVVYWEEESCLLVADLHVGKAAHFRKAGIAVPSLVHRADIEVLAELCHFYSPRRVIFLGDLFHSRFNTDFELVFSLFERFSEISWEIVLGNHDVCSEIFFNEKLMVHGEKLLIVPFLFTHQPVGLKENAYYNLCGHLHPYFLWTQGSIFRQKFPCFWFSDGVGVLPAFGSFTSGKVYNYAPTDRLFVVANCKVIAWQ